MFGQKENTTILNILGRGRNILNQRFIEDRLNLGKPPIEYYTVITKLHLNVFIEIFRFCVYF